MKYDKSYKTESEDSNRMKIFLKNKHEVEEHNEKHSRGKVSFKMSVNKFSDLTHEEFNAQMKGLRKHKIVGEEHFSFWCIFIG